MIDNVFFDTNIFVYAADKDSPEKRKRAMEIIDFHRTTKAVVISTQVLQEFYVTVTRKLKMPLSDEEAETSVRLLGKLPLVQIDKDMIVEAISLSRRHSFSLWDALIVEAAARGGCKKLLSEDMQDGMEVKGVAIENPFRDIPQKPARKKAKTKKK